MPPASLHRKPSFAVFEGQFLCILFRFADIYG